MGQKHAVLPRQLLKAEADDQVPVGKTVQVFKQLRSAGGHEKHILPKAVQTEMKELGQTAGSPLPVQKNPVRGSDQPGGLIKGGPIDQLQRFLQTDLLLRKEGIQPALLPILKGALQLLGRSCSAESSGHGGLQPFIVRVSRMFRQTGKGGIGDAKPFRKLGNGSGQEHTGVFADKINDFLFGSGVGDGLMKKNIGKHEISLL